MSLCYDQGRLKTVEKNHLKNVIWYLIGGLNQNDLHKDRKLVLRL